MKYIVIIPAFNEAENIGHTLDGMVAQTLLPQQVLVINDGSTDATPQLIDQYHQQHPWIKRIDSDAEAKHQPGAKIVRAFYQGFNNIKQHNYDFIVKLDADLGLPPDYFERVAQLFQANPKVGIAGGVNVVQRNGEWVYEDFADKDHVKGAFKAYRKACFEAIGGLRESVGWDSVDELLARYHGWEVQTDQDLWIKHFRPRGKTTGVSRVMRKMGRAMYRMRYGWWITFLSALKAGLRNQPYGITTLAVMQGFAEAKKAGDAFIVNEAEGAFIRKYRWERMKGKLGV
ncbi:MAG: glycosyltransferase family A protein [Bacteroidota bacterium]